MKQHQVTIKDIARMLGLSVSTVSRALKNHPDISVETRNQVIELAHKLNYEPNALALSLRKSRSNIIGVIIPEIVHHFFASVIGGIEDYAYSRGFKVMVCQSNENYEREVLNAQALLSNRVDGLLVSLSKTSLNFDHFRNFINQGVPLVFFDRICPEIESHRVVTDDELGGFLATEHLIKTGCRNIAHFSAPQNLLIGQGRLLGYKKALHEYGLKLNESIIVHCDTRESALEKTASFVEQYPEVDAIFAVNDSTAIAVMQVLSRMGRAIPGKVSVIGFGDGPNALIATPPLTTIEQKGYAIGEEAVRLLIQDITGEIPDANFQHKVITPTLIVRESTRW
ncbi:MAG: LacI family DNA-binding transcriptional regulator [Bacteroidales bacterium]